MEPPALLSPSVLLPIGIVFVILIGVGVAVFHVMKSKEAIRSLDLWSHGAYSLWTGGEDCASWARERARQSLANWYGADGPGAFWEVIATLRRGQTGNVAWDRVRALDLLRIGMAATFVDQDQGRTEAGRICTELQAKYRSWEELAQAFEAGMQAWQRSRNVVNPTETGRVQRNLPKLRNEIWPKIRYDAHLATED